jgi:hypothetical protein
MEMVTSLVCTTLVGIMYLGYYIGVSGMWIAYELCRGTFGWRRLFSVAQHNAWY